MAHSGWAWQNGPIYYIFTIALIQGWTFKLKGPCHPHHPHLLSPLTPTQIWSKPCACQNRSSELLGCERLKPQPLFLQGSQVGLYLPPAPHVTPAPSCPPFTTLQPCNVAKSQKPERSVREGAKWHRRAKKTGLSPPEKVVTF